MAKTKIDPKKLVKVGRLKQVADSLTKSANYKGSALDQIIPVLSYDNEQVRKLLSSQSSDRSSAKRYGEMINKAKAAAAKSKK